MESLELSDAMLEAVQEHQTKVSSDFFPFIRRLLGRVKAESGTEKRRFNRFSCDHKVECLPETGKAFQAHLIELSIGGMRWESEVRLRRGQCVAVNPPQNTAFSDWGAVMVRVAWSKSQLDSDLYLHGAAYYGGIEVLGYSWMAGVLAALGYGRTLGQNRSHIRMDSEIGAVFTQKKTHAQGTILNLGLGGALLLLDEAATEGADGALKVGPWSNLPAVDLTTQVTSVRPNPDGEGFLHGLMFTNLEGEALRVLRDYVLELMESS